MKSNFIAGKTYIPASGKFFDKEEINNAIKVAKQGWWTEGEFAARFEEVFGKFLGIKFISLVNSGSSANLLALAALTCQELGKKRLKKGDEFITTPVCFPTTVNPGIQYGLTPVFIDAKINTLNIDTKKIEQAITSKTKLIMIAHTLGKPFYLPQVLKLVKKYDLWLIEDCCDALGSRYDGRLVGNFGHIATFSFYPAHQITMAEGGAIATQDPLIHKLIRQLRDWGRDCWCATGKDNTCGQRFNWKKGELPKGFDHKYIYSQIGYNLKLTDFQAAIGLAQLKKLPFFLKKRQENYHDFYNFFKKFDNFFTLPKEDDRAQVSYFGFPLLVKEDAPFTKNELMIYLENRKIGTRNVFAGNILRHPAYIKHKKKFKIIGEMENADKIMENGFWIGVWPGIDRTRREYIKKTIARFIQDFASRRFK